MNNNFNIGVFDSGVGGTTVLKAIINALPNENILYYGDNGNAPYGERTLEDIQRLCLKIMEFFKVNNCKAVVIACNTATAASLEIINERYNIPVIGVINPGAKSAIKASKSRNIGVLSTPFTAKSNAYANAIKKLDDSITVYQEGCSELCPMIENSWETYENREEILKNHISTFPETVDTVVLGCTHYPIIREDIAKLFTKTIVDPAKETAIELQKTLEKLNLLNSSTEKGKIDFFVSGEIEKFKKVAEKFLGFKIDNIYQVDK